MLHSNRTSSVASARERRNRRESPFLTVAKRIALYLFVALLCIRIGLAFSFYQQSLDEAVIKEKRLADLRLEQRRVAQRLSYLDTADGRTIEAYKQGWIPAGSRLLILPPQETSRIAQSNPWKRPEPEQNFLDKTADRAIGVYRRCREKASTWWHHSKPEE